MRVAATLLLLCLGLALGACGDSGDSPADKAFGDTTGQDRKAFAEVSGAMSEFAHDNADFARYAQQEDMRGAQKAVDRMTTQLEHAQDASLKFDNAEAATWCRTTLP